MRLVRVLVLLCALPLVAQEVETDLTASRSMLEVLQAMHAGLPRAEIEQRLDALLATRPYRVMFAHYNRSWRPDHLPPDVFKRMILGLRFADAYRTGENERADQMRGHWTKSYADLASYETKLHQLESADFGKLIREGVSYAQSWLPAEWRIPSFYLPILPHGGSPAFTIDGSQGYDFFQLDPATLVGTIAHESHHLGVAIEEPASLTPAESVAFRVLSITIAEGTATKFVSGAPPGCVPAIPGVRYDTFSPALTKDWNAHAATLPDLIRHQARQLERALAGELDAQALNHDLREYWLAGTIGRAYVLGAEMFGAIDLAFGKEAVFTAMKDPRRLFELYNAALDAKPALSCPRVPERAVQQALSIGKRGSGEKAP